MWPLSQRGAWAAGWTLTLPCVSTCLPTCLLDPWSPCSVLVLLIRGSLAQLSPPGMRAHCWGQTRDTYIPGRCARRRPG